MNKKKWLSNEDYKKIQKTMPIVCVDIVPFRILKENPKKIEIGLILRPSIKIKRWCFVGGRILKDEIIPDAIHRQLTETLGDKIKYNFEKDTQPVYVAQYFSKKTDDYGFDPRQHSVGLTYFLNIEGEIKPGGEALDFKWFNIDELPPHAEFGFEQDRLLKKILELKKII